MAIQDSGSNYQFYDKKIEPNVKRSSFKLDYLNNMTVSQGVLVPYRLLHTLPNSEYNLELETLLRAINVPKVLLQSRQRVFYHEYHVSFQQMWPSWSTFMSKGVSGTTILPLPKIRFSISGRVVVEALKTVFNVKSSSDLNTFDSPLNRNKILNYFGLGFGSLSDYLGFPTPKTIFDRLETIITQLKTTFTHYDANTEAGIYVDYNAFPFFAYFSIFRNFYLNWNLNVNDKKFFPDNINDFALINPDIADGNIFFADWNSARSFNWTTYSPGKDNLSSPAFHSFGILKNRNFVDDYFTSALPWPMRGNIPQLSIDGTAELSDVPVGFRYFKQSGGAADFLPLSINMFTNAAKDTFSTLVNDRNKITPQTDNAAGGALGGIYHLPTPVGDSTRTQTVNGELYTTGLGNLSFSSGFTWEMIRNLSISTMIAEKMARTNGSYKEFIRTFFDDTPSNQINNVPRYIGGHVQPVVYTEVLQQSSDSNTPLGTVGAKGITASDGYIGKCYSNDFGLILGILSIMPDTYYSQGLRRQDMYSVQEDFYLPERAELGMQGIYKGELFVSGNPDTDDDLFGYQNRYDEWRYRPNEVHGQLANPQSTTFFPFTQSRYFTSAPVLSNEFVSTKNNIRRDYLTALDEVDFVCQIACRCTGVQPLPYRAIPVGLK